MKRKTIFVIIFVISVSLAGILLTQIYWVHTAFKLKEEQFDNSVRLTLKGVINQILLNNNDTVFQKKLIGLKCGGTRLTINDYIDNSLLDSLLSADLKCMGINIGYYYGVYSRHNNKFVIGKYKDNENQLIESQYQFSLSSIYKPGKYYISIYFTNKTHLLLHRMELWVFLSVLFLIILIISITFAMFSLLHQKKASEIKTDFINNMTHELKTPIATASLAAEMIQRDEVVINPEKIRRYASVILDENNRLQNQVEQVLHVALLESTNQQFKIKRLNIHNLLEAVLSSFELRIAEANIRIELTQDAPNPYIMGDNVHVLNVLYNLIDNAIKYTPDNPLIEISTWNENNNIVISVKDNGIGIRKEHQQNIFKNLYRVPTGNIHEIRGFGLGLYYVKTVLDRLNGKIELTSELGKGSNFELIFSSVAQKT